MDQSTLGSDSNVESNGTNGTVQTSSNADSDSADVVEKSLTTQEHSDSRSESNDNDTVVSKPCSLDEELNTVSNDLLRMMIEQSSDAGNSFLIFSRS